MATRQGVRHERVACMAGIALVSWLAGWFMAYYVVIQAEAIRARTAGALGTSVPTA